MARKALDGLSIDFEKYLRAETAVVAGDAAWRLGRSEEMLSLFDQALRDCPSLFRAYRVAIPIQVADDGSSLRKRWVSGSSHRRDSAKTRRGSPSLCGPGGGS